MSRFYHFPGLHPRPAKRATPWPWLSSFLRSSAAAATPGVQRTRYPSAMAGSVCSGKALAEGDADREWNGRSGPSPRRSFVSAGLRPLPTHTGRESTSEILVEAQQMGACVVSLIPQSPHLRLFPPPGRGRASAGVERRMVLSPILTFPLARGKGWKRAYNVNRSGISVIATINPSRTRTTERRPSWDVRRQYRQPWYGLSLAH